MAESKSIFYGYKTYSASPSYVEIGSYPTASGGTVPDPTCSGYDFLRWYPLIDSDRKKVKSISLTYTVDGGTETTYALAKSSERNVEKTATGYDVYDIWSYGSGDPKLARIKVVDLYEYDISISDGTTELFSHKIYKASETETFTETAGGHTYSCTVTSVFVEYSEESPTVPTEDIYYYAIYKAIGCTISYGYYDADNKYQNFGSPDFPKTVEPGTTFVDGAGNGFVPTGIPTKGDGWTFDGWIPKTSDYAGKVIASDLQFFATFRGMVKSLTIDGNGADNIYTTSVSITWGEMYPSIPVLPKKTGFSLSGIWLESKNTGSGETTEVCKCYDAYGNPIATVTQSVLKETGYTFKLLAKWIQDSIYDLDGLRKSVGIVPMPFASLPSSRASIPGGQSISEKSISFKYGLTEPFAQKLVKDGSGGRVITRQMVNAIGNLGSQCQFFEQCGGYYTFDGSFCSANNGYPKNAILQHYDVSSNQLRTVISLVDDNKFDFTELGVDGEHWKYVDDNPEVSIMVDYANGIDISDSILIETGVQDLYEVPFDSFFQLFALSYIDCSSLKRDEIENVLQAVTKDEFGNYVYETINGMYYTVGRGLSYLDVYHSATEAFGSVIVGGHFPFEWCVFWPKADDPWKHAEKICPTTPLSCGIMLSKGDKIRLRNSFTDKLPEGSVASKTNNAIQVIKERLFTDEVIKRKYIVRSAMLYPRGVAL